MTTVEHYEVGCICALWEETVALRSFLDKETPCPEIPSSSTSSQDKNAYTTGVLSNHHIVIGSLPQGSYGVSQATSVIENMVRSFPNLRFCLMVGIGGGAPSNKHDVRLGDVVVSAPEGREGGVLQYDHGKDIQNQKFRINQHLNQPPGFLMAAVSKLIQNYELDGNPLQEKIDESLERRPRLKEKWRHPNHEFDQLYQSNVLHPDIQHGSCRDICGTELSKLVVRSPRPEGPDQIQIHHGIIASGSKLMKNAHVRDALAQEENVLCFETEAAGLVNQFPCLVIRGICDYSDTHKNDTWRRYAAMVAASYAKELLGVLRSSSFATEPRIKDIVQGL